MVVGLLVLAVGGVLSGAASSAERRLTRARQVGQEALQRHLQDLGIGGSAHGLVEQRARTDEQGTSHMRYQQTYRGLEVFEGEVIVHVDGRDEVELTSALRGHLRLDTRPVVDSAAAATTAAAEAGLAGRFEATPVLKVLPRGERSDYDRLVWHVRVTGRTHFDPMVQWDVFVDANTGEVALAFDSLQTTAAVGTGKTMYSGDVSLSTDFTSSTYYLRDLTRGGGNYTCDVNNRSDSIFRRATCTTFTRTTTSSGTTSRTAPTARRPAPTPTSVCRPPGTTSRTSIGRNGIDGAGKKTYSRVHYGNRLRERVLERLLLLHDLRRRRRQPSTRSSRSTWPGTRCPTAS